jgi:hypothetical protein
MLPNISKTKDIHDFTRERKGVEERSATLGVKTPRTS